MLNSYVKLIGPNSDEARGSQGDCEWKDFCCIEDTALKTEVFCEKQHLDSIKDCNITALSLTQ